MESAARSPVHGSSPSGADEGGGACTSATGGAVGATQAGAPTGNPRIRDCGRYGRLIQFPDSSYVWEKRAPRQPVFGRLGWFALGLWFAWLLWAAFSAPGRDLTAVLR